MQMRKEHLQSFVDVVPYLGEVINEDINIGVMNSKEYIITQDGKTIKSHNKAGDKNTYDDFALRTIRDKKPISFEDVSDHFDYPVEVTFTPVVEEDGSATDILIAVVKNIAKRRTMDEASKEIGKSFEQANQTISGIATDSQNLSAAINEIVKYTNETQKKLGEIDSLIKGIKKIALKSNILAINAGIEAVHAGNAGKGFSVIANEMGNLSKSSDEAAEVASKSLNDIKNAIETINEKIDAIGTYSSSQAASTQEISATINEIFKTFRTLCDSN